MDEFGVLVQGYGIKAQGKSAPMAASKTATTKNTHTYTSVNVDQSFGAKPFSNGSISGSGSFFNDQNDDVFGFNSRSNRPNNYASSDLFDDVFQVPKTNSGSPSVGGGGGFGFDVESMFKGSMNLNSKPSDVDDDLIWGFSGKGSSNVVVEGDDLLSSDPVDDFFGKLGNSGSNRRGSEDLRSDDLIPGFGRSNTSNDSVERAQAVFGEKNSGSSTLEELEDFVTGGTKKTAKGHVNGTSVKKEEKNGSSNVVVGIDDYLSSDPVDDFFGKLEKSGSDQTGSKGTISDDLIPGFGRSNATNDRAQATSTEKISGSSSLEELEDFVTGGTKKIAKGHVVKKDKAEEANFIDIEGTLNGHSVHNGKVKNASEQMFQEEAPDLDSFFPAYVKKSVPVNEGTFNKRNTTEVPNLFSETAFRMEKKVSPRDFPDDFSSIFGVAPTSEVFEEVEGESDDRRRARLGRHKKAMARMEQALAELNQREYQAQQEQEERHRIAEVMEVDMKRWAAGKEGNLRALLSSLQQVLAPELGWQPVTLTDLITSSQVKLAYKKAALCVHPDKVQQKGASLQQKYVAEKAFDLLKEAWNKFSTEELR